MKFKVVFINVDNNKLKQTIFHQKYKLLESVENIPRENAMIESWK